jgi:hypothetical protein
MKTVNQPVFLIYRPIFSVYRSIFPVFIFSRFLKYWIFWIVTDRFSMNRRNWFLQISQKPTRFHRYLNPCLWVDTPRSQERVIKNLKWWLSRSTDHLQCHRCNCRHWVKGLTVEVMKSIGCEAPQQGLNSVDGVVSNLNRWEIMTLFGSIEFL